jgi:hypothetical protein
MREEIQMDSEKKRLEDSNRDTKLLAWQTERDRQQKRINDALLETIKCMRGFLDDAEREVNRVSDHSTPTEKIRQVTSQMAWGLANSTSRIGVAFNALTDLHEAELKITELQTTEKTV